MTCIVGIETSKGAWMAGDSASISDWDIRQTELTKVFTVKQYIVGYTSSFRMGQILQHMVEYPLCTSPTESFMVSVFIETVRKSLKEFGYTKIENNEESGGNFLVAVKGKLFIVHSDFQINRYLGGMYSVGIGSSYALGAMYTKRNSSPEVVLKSGLIAASNFCLGVCKPFSQPMFSEKEEN